MNMFAMVLCAEIHLSSLSLSHTHTHTHTQEGLFSDGGRNAEIEEIMNMLDTGGRELPGSAYSVASALLTFLAALADPVVPVALHQRCMECYNNTTLCKQVRYHFSVNSTRQTKS